MQRTFSASATEVFVVNFKTSFGFGGASKGHCKAGRSLRQALSFVCSRNFLAEDSDCVIDSADKDNFVECCQIYL